MKKLLLIVALLFASTVAMAEQGDVWISIGTVGEHFENNHNANNFNPGIAAFYEVVDRVSVGYGVYRNSYQDTKRWIGNQYTYPTLTSEALYIDYKFWNNNMWDTHVGYYESNHYYSASSSGTLVQGYEGFTYATACRRFEEGSNWKGCLQATVWHNNPGPGIDEAIGFKIQYNFGDPFKND